MVNFRRYVLDSGLEIFGGKDSENNDKLVFEAKPTDVLLHTEAPGSPFVNVGAEASKVDIKEAAVFCAKYSQDWRDKRKDVKVNVFRRCDMKKGRKAKSGSWEVSKYLGTVKVKRGEILKYEESLV
jgi:predicted ribosome quality control (RQC) complex YloA/Tae2 family protein